MMTIKNFQMIELVNISLVNYISMIRTQLLEEPFSVSFSRMFPNKTDYNEINKWIKGIIIKIEDIGFIYEDDITKLIFLYFIFEEIDNDTGLGKWINAILISQDISTENKLEAFFEILPETHRNTVFQIGLSNN